MFHLVLWPIKNILWQRSDDDGTKNVCLDPLNLLNKGNFSFLQLNFYFNKGCIQIQKEKGEFVVMYLRPPLTHQEFHAVHCSRVVDVRNMYQKAWCTCRAVVLLIKPIVFSIRHCRCCGCLGSQFSDQWSVVTPLNIVLPCSGTLQ